MTNSDGLSHRLRESQQPVNDSKPRDALFVGSVEKAFMVLEAFRGHSALSLSEVAITTGLGKSAAQRFCHTLVELGYLKRDPRSRQLKPALRLLELGFSYSISEPIISTAAPFLLRAREKSNKAVNLALPRGTDVVYVMRQTYEDSPYGNPPVGGRVPMFCTASGRAYLSALPKEECDAILAQSPLQPFTPHTLTDLDQLNDALETARMRGFASADQECIVGERTIGAPIYDRFGRVIASMNICVYGNDWTMAKVDKTYGDLLLRTARQVSEAVSNNPNFS